MGVFAQSPDLIFHSGFEPAVDTFDHDSSSIDLKGIDVSVSPPNNWQDDLEDHPNIGYWKIQFKGGDETDRLAEVVPDPLDPTNNTLQFWVRNVNSGNNGRVQGNIYKNNGIRKLFYSTRLYLPGDFNLLKKYPDDFTFLTLMEFWNNANWTDEDYMFRVKVNLVKITDEPDSLRVRATAQARDLENDNWGNDIWEFYNTDYVVPIQKWMTLRVYFVEGNDCSGRFILTIEPDGESETIVHNVRNFTHHPEDPSPNGLSEFNPIKLYTDDDIVNYMNDKGGMLNIFWDDFELWKDSVFVTSDDCLAGGITFSSQSQIDDFATNHPNCKSISGDVIINSGGSDITSLEGISQITTIEGSLKIQSNSALLKLAGLDNLTCVKGFLHIESNSALSDISALSNLRTVHGALVISDNDALMSLSGLENIAAIDGYLEVSESVNLTSLSGLEAIDYTTITNLVVRSNNNLSTCELKNICEYLDNGGTATIIGNTTGCSDQTEVESACLSVLPVELSHFSGKEVAGDAHIFWQTASETNNDYFQLEHGTDGRNFQPIAVIQGNGTVSGTQDYQFVHTRAHQGQNYYRLMQVDFDGGYEYSKIISVEIEHNEIFIQPNPTNGMVEIKGVNSDHASLKVFDALGRLIQTSDLAISNTVNLSNQPKGIYFFIIQANNQSVIKKIIRK